MTWMATRGCGFQKKKKKKLKAVTKVANKTAGHLLQVALSWLMSRSHGEFLSKYLHLAQTNPGCCISVVLNKCSSNQACCSSERRWRAGLPRAGTQVQPRRRWHIRGACDTGSQQASVQELCTVSHGVNTAHQAWKNPSLRFFLWCF